MKSNLASSPSSEATKLKTDPLQGPSLCLTDAALGHSIKENPLHMAVESGHSNYSRFIKLSQNMHIYNSRFTDMVWVFEGFFFEGG